MTKVALLDYGMGNLHSASKALSVVGAEVSITNDSKVVAAADKIVFPGVGAMRRSEERRVGEECRWGWSG